MAVMCRFRPLCVALLLTNIYFIIIFICAQQQYKVSGVLVCLTFVTKKCNAYNNSVAIQFSSKTCFYSNIWTLQFKNRIRKNGLDQQNYFYLIGINSREHSDIFVSFAITLYIILNIIYIGIINP